MPSHRHGDAKTLSNHILEMGICSILTCRLPYTRLFWRLPRDTYRNGCHIQAYLSVIKDFLGGEGLVYLFGVALVVNLTADIVGAPSFRTMAIDILQRYCILFFARSTRKVYG